MPSEANRIDSHAYNSKTEEHVGDIELNLSDPTSVADNFQRAQKVRLVKEKNKRGI